MSTIKFKRPGEVAAKDPSDLIQLLCAIQEIVHGLKRVELHLEKLTGEPVDLDQENIT